MAPENLFLRFSAIADRLPKSMEEENNANAQNYQER